LVHECLHVTVQVLSDRGVLLCGESEEVFALLRDRDLLQFLCLLTRMRKTATSTSIDCEDEETSAHVSLEVVMSFALRSRAQNRDCHTGGLSNR